MKLIVLYGPPAVGKLTVARELIKITGYKLIHNHLAANLVASIFDFGTNPFYKLNDKFQLDMIEAAARAKVDGLVFTKCYIKGKHDSFIRVLVLKAKKHKIKTCFIRLSCDEKILMRRVKDPSRKKHGKLNCSTLLKQVFSKEDRISKIAGVKNLEINNTNIAPRRVALQVKRHFKL